MQTEASRSLEAIFSEALDRTDPAQRTAYLNDACQGDAHLLEQINQLLTAHESAGDFLTEPKPTASKEIPQIAGFRIGRELGRGSVGAVYEAYDEQLQRSVALKILSRDNVAQSLAEARRAASLRDPAIVTIYSVHENPSAPAISMELIEGFPVDRATASLNFEQKARILLQIAQALAVAHRAGIIHRDLKPENVLVTPDLQAKVLDFGLAISFTEGEAARAFFEGTPRYASPEQVGGRPLTPATDIFSFGSLMFKILTGRPPFDGATALEILDAICNSHPPFLKDVSVGVPEGLQAICLACLAWEPARRPSAVDLATDLRRFLAGEPVRLRPALYGDILRQKISEYSNELIHWQRQGMISHDEKDRLESVHRRILADEDHWIIDARKISTAQTILYASTWLVVISAILAVWLARDQLPAPLTWLAPLCGTAWLFGAGLWSWRRREPLASASFLAAAALSLAPTVLALLKEANILSARPQNVTQLLENFSNAQVLVACLTSLGASLFAWARLKMTGFAWTSAVLAAASYCGFLLPANWLAQKPETMALWLLPLIAMEIPGLACERRERVRWSLPFDLIALVTLVGCLDVMAFQGPTFAMLGLAPNPNGFWNPDRLNHFSIALNGSVFLALTLITERAKSLDLRRASRILEPLALLHMLGPLFANALAQHDHPRLRIDVALYFATTFLLLILGPWRSSWRMFVGALGGLAFGSYLIIHLELLRAAPFTLTLGLFGIVVSAGTYVRLSQTHSARAKNGASDGAKPVDACREQQ